ncbi:MAG: hypothetical protein R3B13_04380 [Polyangiaceae bacterium]
MDGPPSTPDPATQQRAFTAGGTIVGMPAVVPAPGQEPLPVDFETLKSTTLKSVYSSPPAILDTTPLEGEPELDAGPCSDAFHPERWSSPPPSGLTPIYPCEEPEDEDEARVLTSAAVARLRAYAERNPEPAQRTSAPSEPVDTAPVVNAQPAAGQIQYVDEFAYIPMRRSTEDRTLLTIAGLAAAAMLVASIGAYFLL